jgi:integrase
MIQIKSRLGYQKQTKSAMAKEIRLIGGNSATDSAKSNEKLTNQKQYIEAKLYDHKGDPDKEWYVYYYCINPATGKMQRDKYSKDLNKRYLGLNKSQHRKAKYEIANEIINTINRYLENGYNPFDTNPIVVELKRPALEVYKQVIEQIKPRIEHRTWQQYTGTVSALEKYLFFHQMLPITIDELTQAHYYQFQDFCTKELNVKKNSSLNSHLSYLIALTNHAVKRGFAKQNPFAGIKKLKEQESDQFQPWTTEEKNLLAEKLPALSYPLWVYANIIYCTGLRPLDIQRLKIKHFNLEKGEVFIPASAVKNDKTRISVLPSFAVDIIRKHVEGQNPEHALFSIGMLPGAKPIVRNRISEHWLKIVKKQIGINKNAYALKHTMVINLSETDISSKQIQQQIGHHSLEMTDIYARQFSTKNLSTLKEKFPPLGNVIPDK